MNKYRIENKIGQVLCHTNTAQRAADIIFNCGIETIDNFVVVNTDDNGRTQYTYDSLLCAMVSL